MRVSLRKFEKQDIPNKIKWINDPRNNQFLHYNVPLEYEATLAWFEQIKTRIDRYDAIIEVDDTPCGLIGLLSIDQQQKKAEYYISMGETALKGKGIATEASKQILDFAFNELVLEEVYLYTEIENTVAQRLFENIGFERYKALNFDIIKNGEPVGRFLYSISKNKRRG